MEDIPHSKIGVTGGTRLDVAGLVDLELNELEEAYEKDLFTAATRSFRRAGGDHVSSRAAEKVNLAEKFALFGEHWSPEDSGAS